MSGGCFRSAMCQIRGTAHAGWRGQLAPISQTVTPPFPPPPPPQPPPPSTLPSRHHLPLHFVTAPKKLHTLNFLVDLIIIIFAGCVFPLCVLYTVVGGLVVVVGGDGGSGRLAGRDAIGGRA